MAASGCNVLVVGAGGVGAMACYALEAGGRATVTAVLRSNYDVVRERGFDITSVDHGEVRGWRPTTVRNTVPNIQQEPDLSPYDFIVVATKNIPEVPPAVADLIATAVTPGLTAILLLQNGLNIEQPLMAAFPRNPVLSGISLIGVAEDPPGTLRQDDHDVLSVGVFAGHGPLVTPDSAVMAARRFVDLYGACAPGVGAGGQDDGQRGGLRVIYDVDARRTRWRKLLYNTSFNSVSALMRGMDTTRMRQSGHIIDSLVRPLIQDVLKTARAVGVDLAASGTEADDDAEEKLIKSVILTDPWCAFCTPSMGQDVSKGNYIEVENIVGEPLREAERVGVEVPTLKIVYSILEGLQWQTMERKGWVALPLRRASWWS